MFSTPTPRRHALDLSWAELWHLWHVIAVGVAIDALLALGLLGK